MCGLLDWTLSEGEDDALLVLTGFATRVAVLVPVPRSAAEASLASMVPSQAFGNERAGADTGGRGFNFGISISDAATPWPVTRGRSSSSSSC